MQIIGRDISRINVSKYKNATLTKLKVTIIT